MSFLKNIQDIYIMSYIIIATFLLEKNILVAMLSDQVRLLGERVLKSSFLFKVILIILTNVVMTFLELV